MFDALGKTISKWWPLVLFAWILGFAWLVATAPPWRSVAQDGEFNFLPLNTASRHAEILFKEAFPDDLLTSSIVLLLHRDDGAGEIRDVDRTFVSDVLTPKLDDIVEERGGFSGTSHPSDPAGDDRKPTRQTKGKLPSIVAGIHTFQDRGIGALLESPDHRSLLVVVDLTTDFLEQRNFPIVEEIEQAIAQLQQRKQIPAGLEISVTGSATLGRDMTRAEQSSAAAARFWTILLVVGLLIIIYRAPLLPLIPLATLYISVEVAVRLLALFAEWRWISVFQGLQVYITVVAYGAGVDYCLFLTARYRESLAKGDDHPGAITHAVGRVGAALTASAGTVICGIAMLSFAKFGKFHQAGIGLSLSLLIVFCAVMTFTPALLRAAGRWAFWPGRGSDATISETSARAPNRTGTWTHMVENIWIHIGNAVERKPGLIWALSVALMLPLFVVGVRTYTQVTYGLIEQLPQTAPSVLGAKQVSAHFPSGVTGPITILLSNPKVDFGSGDGIETIESLVDRLKEQQRQLKLADIRSVATPIGITQAAEHPFAGLSITEQVAARGALRRKAREYYVTDAPEFERHITRLDLILQSDPFARSSIDELERIEQAIRNKLPDELKQHTELSASGPTASVRDLRSIEDFDRILINSSVLAVVFAILAILLRKIVVPVYLILTVLLSYFATLGTTYLVFWALDPQGFAGLDWTVPIFLFTLLVAVGEDYNIFLMTRVHEEQASRGPVHGITWALERTGSIITSCGIIMAGTFSSLMAGSLSRMVELGFALTFGVLLETFVVRPILVPAFLMLLENGTFGELGKQLGARGVHARI